MDALAVITVSNPPPSRIDNGVRDECYIRVPWILNSMSTAGEMPMAARFMVVRCGVMPGLYLSCRVASSCAVDGVSMRLVMDCSRFSG